MSSPFPAAFLLHSLLPQLSLLALADVLHNSPEPPPPLVLGLSHCPTSEHIALAFGLFFVCVCVCVFGCFFFLNQVWPNRKILAGSNSWPYKVTLCHFQGALIPAQMLGKLLLAALVWAPSALPNVLLWSWGFLWFSQVLARSTASIAQTGI